MPDEAGVARVMTALRPPGVRVTSAAPVANR